MHPEHGAIEMDVHALSDLSTGAMTFVVFRGGTFRSEQTQTVLKLAQETGSTLRELSRAHITDQMAQRLAEALLHDTSPVVVIPAAALMGEGPMRATHDGDSDE
jgi:hypothetical protein